MGSSANSRLRPQGQPPSPGKPSALGTAGNFSAPIGTRVDAADPSGYYIDLRSKAVSSERPPIWYRRGSPRPHVSLIQWGLGCHERYLAGDGADWLQAARWVADELLEIQQGEGPQAGGWVHDFPYKHTYSLTPPWLSGMAQGEGASLLVRIHRATGERRYADAALAALAPMRTPASEGGVAANLGPGRVPEEYPTSPASYVLNGCIFALWGCYDVAVALTDSGADELAREGIEALADSLQLFDTGWWSRYDLFPHPLVNLASPVYHRLHINQLRAMALIEGDPRFEATAERFESYAASSLNRARAYSAKVLFRLAVPRNRWLAHRLPWTGDRRR